MKKHFNAPRMTSMMLAPHDLIRTSTIPTETIIFDVRIDNTEPVDIYL